MSLWIDIRFKSRPIELWYTFERINFKFGFVLQTVVQQFFNQMKKKYNENIDFHYPLWANVPTFIQNTFEPLTRKNFPAG